MRGGVCTWRGGGRSVGRSVACRVGGAVAVTWLLWLCPQRCDFCAPSPGAVAVRQWDAIPWERLRQLLGVGGVQPGWV